MKIASVPCRAGQDGATREPGPGGCGQPGPGLVQGGSEERRAALGGDPGEEPRLAARARAQVQPEPVLAIGGGPGQGQDGELARLVLNSRPALGHGVECAWITVI